MTMDTVKKLAPRIESAIRSLRSRFEDGSRAADELSKAWQSAVRMAGLAEVPEVMAAVKSIGARRRNLDALILNYDARKGTENLVAMLTERKELYRMEKLFDTDDFDIAPIEERLKQENV